MIHRFRINNFQSIREDVELDLRIPGTTPAKPCFRTSRSRPDFRLPSAVVLVGPNGAGKSALLNSMVETIRFMAYSCSNQSDYIPGFFPFLSSETVEAPTQVEIDLDVPQSKTDGDSIDSLLRYILELERDKTNLLASRVSYEALYSFPKGRPRRLLERKKEQPIYVAKETGLRPRDDRLYSIPENVSAVSGLARMGVDSFQEILRNIESLQTSINCAKSNYWMPDENAIAHAYRECEHLVEKVSNKLHRLDLGIKDMNLQLAEGGEWLLTFEHHGLDVPVALPTESTGTQRLVHMLPSLDYALHAGQPAIMDAFDSGLHAELAAEVINWFRREETNRKKAQLLCSLYNPSILDDLEKEEVFIVEKSRDGATRIHGARNVSGLRRGTNLQKQYRSGALGGLPAFG